MDILRIAPLAAAGLIGILYGRDVWTLGLSALVPILVFTRTRRGEAAATVLLYYAATSWPIVPCARSFWSLSGPSFTPAFIWLAATLLLSLPWIVFWSSTRSQIYWRAPLSMLIGAIPPFGIIGWASPLTAAGVAFPGSGWLGVVAVALIAGLPIKAVAVVAVASNLIYVPPPTPPGWSAINTTINTAARVDPVPSGI